MYGGRSAKQHSIILKDRFNVLAANPNYFVIGDSDDGEALIWNNLFSEALFSKNSEEKAWLLEVATIEAFVFQKENML